MTHVEGCLGREVCFHIEYFMLGEMGDYTADAWPRQDEFTLPGHLSSPLAGSRVRCSLMLDSFLVLSLNFFVYDFV